MLSFPDDLDDGSPSPSVDDERELGDVVISVETAERQADEQGHSLWHELQLLSIHGYLHLSGYDHETDSGEMMQLQGRLVRELCEGDR